MIDGSLVCHAAVLDVRTGDLDGFSAVVLSSLGNYSLPFWFLNGVIAVDLTSSFHLIEGCSAAYASIHLFKNLWKSFPDVRLCSASALFGVLAVLQILGEV